MGHDELLISDPNIAEVHGTATALIGMFAPFSGSVVTFRNDRTHVGVVARQDISATQWLFLRLVFSADIENGSHPFVKGGKISSVSFAEVDNGAYKFHMAKYDSGDVEINLDLVAGTLEAGFKLKFEGSPLPEQRDYGAFRNVSGLEYAE